MHKKIKIRNTSQLIFTLLTCYLNSLNSWLCWNPQQIIYPSKNWLSRKRSSLYLSVLMKYGLRFCQNCFWKNSRICALISLELKKYLPTHAFKPTFLRRLFQMLFRLMKCFKSFSLIHCGLGNAGYFTLIKHLNIFVM